MKLSAITKKALTLLTFSFLVLIQQANALQMNPMSIVLKPSGGGAKQSFTIGNETNKPIAVKLFVTTRQQVNYKEVRKAADQDFLIYPAQTVIPPRSTQNVRVEWLGNQSLNQEKSYRLVAQQLHVDLGGEKKTGIITLMKMEGTLYVQPTSSKSNIKVASVRKHGNMLAITVQNSGTRHQMLLETQLTLSNGNQVLNYNKNDLKGLEGYNVLAGTTRRFMVKVPNGYRDQNWNASLKYKK